MSKAQPNGFTLMSVIVTTAISGILAMLILTIVEDAAKTLARGNIVDSLEGMVRATMSVLNNKRYCANALRGANSGAFVTYNGGVVDILNIYVQNQNASPNATLLLSATPGGPNNQVAGGARVSFIRYRERSPGNGRGTFAKGGVAHTTYQGEVMIGITGANGVGGGDVVRLIPYTAVTNPANQIVDCQPTDGSTEALCRAVEGTYDPVTGVCANLIAPLINCQAACTSGGNCPLGDCPPPSPTPPGLVCNKLYHVTGFDVTTGATTQTSPRCSCLNQCYLP